MEEFQIDRDNGACLVFKGEIIAQVSNEQHTLTIYLTEAERFVCHRLDHSNKKSLAVVCDDHKAIIDFFGCDCMAKDLYIKAGNPPLSWMSTIFWRSCTRWNRFFFTGSI